jgi:integrase
MNIQTYFKVLNKDINRYFRNGNTHEKIEADLRKIYTHYDKLGRPALSQRTFFNSVKQFMFSYDKSLKDLEFWDTLKQRSKGAEPSSDEAILNAADIKTILNHGNPCSKALYLILASSGRRISEILALTPDDVNTNTHPTTINIRKGLSRQTTKTGQKTLCFISDEATEAYNIWMKERDNYLQTACKRSYRKPKDPNDPRIFPMSYHNALLMWSTMLMKAQLVDIVTYEDKWSKKQRRKVKKKHKGERLFQHPHSIRRFYRSYLGDADLAEYLMGHGTILTKTYRQMKPEDLAAKYSKLMPNVTIFSTAPDLSGINEEIKILKEDNQRLRNDLQDYQTYMEKIKMMLRDQDKKGGK